MFETVLYIHVEYSWNVDVQAFGFVG